MLLLLQADQFGILHAPYAPGRTHLQEFANTKRAYNSYQNLTVLLHDKEGTLKLETIHGLCIDYADVTDGLSKISQNSKL